MPNGLKALRERKGLSQEAAAAEFGMSKGGYIKLEHGERSLKAQWIKVAMRVFGANETQVIDEEAALAQSSASDEIKAALSQTDEAARRHGLAQFLKRLADPEGALDWLEIVEDLEAAFQRPPADDPKSLDLNLIRDRAVQEADRAIRKLRRYKEKKA